MNPFQFNQNNLDDVVFETRNQQYGAYALRKSHDAHLNTGVATSMGVLLLFGGICYLFTRNTDVIAPVLTNIQDKIVTAKTLSKIEYILDPPDVAPPARQLSGAGRSQSFQIAPDPIVPVVPVAPTAPVGPAAGVTGTASTDPNAMAISGGTATSGTGNVETGTETGMEVFTYVTEKPEYEGGIEAMVAFITNNLQYPTLARESGIEGKVIVSFVVMPDGNIANTQLIKGIGFGCDEEAMRVVELMKGWKAGKQNGRKVAVKMILPIHFSLR